ncbi:sulfatase-like hydrolase/transferase [Microlunatus soli]|uniref:Arylsulfatase A n=1 Tax=Microlunatus soli TaxID=630515 RepID=A0A1H1QXM7_9ACTN|nr:sulfatase-like hydrolase/transferase [Microlunatus soli]SDS28187.1 Arylsulfatase A [Microlunatus soli]
MTTPERPHLIVIYTDDLGYGDVGFLGPSDIATPHLDALAAGGATMRRWYSNSPVCSPSRAALLTGCHPSRAGVDHILGAPRGRDGLPPQPTLASRLADAGYATSMVGKWHLGTSESSSPRALGFGSFFGFLAGCVDYYSHIMYWGDHHPIHDLWTGTQETWRNGEYLTTMITDAAVQVIDEVADDPMFLFVSYNAPHYPLHAPQEYVDRNAHLPEDRRMIAAMMSAVDDGVGEIVAALERQGIRDNTIILFSSDNGPSAEERNWLNGEEIAFAGGSAGGLRGHKGSLYEGGIRMPTLWSWPARITPGTQITTCCQMSDVLPTVLDAAGIPPADQHVVDGSSVLDLLTGTKSEPEDRLLYWEYDGQTAVSDGTWKLVRNVRERLGAPTVEKIGLYHLAVDEAETSNLYAADHSEAVRLGAALDDFETRLTGWQQQISQQGQELSPIPTAAP